MRVDFYVQAPAGVTFAAAVGVCGGVQGYARLLVRSRRGPACSVDVPADAPAVWIFVFEQINTHWVLRGGGAVRLAGAAGDVGVHMHTLAGTPGESDGVAAPPAVTARVEGGSRAVPRLLAPGRHEKLMQYSREARAELLTAMPALEYPPPLLARTLHGTAPVGVTFATRAEVGPDTLHGLLALMCHLERSECEPADLGDAPPQLVARVLARVALVANTVRYIPDEARAGAARVGLTGATPDAPPDAAPGTVQTNIYLDPAVVWAADCEDDTLVSAAVWRAFEDHGFSPFDALGYQFLVLAVTVARAQPGAYHVCAALMHPTRPCALVESVVRTCGVMQYAASYRAPATEAARREERPLVLLPSGLLNDWYDRVAFALDPRQPLDLLVPRVNGAYGATVAQLLNHEAALEPMHTAIPPELRAELLGNCMETPRINLSARRVTVAAGGPGLGGGRTMCAEDGAAPGAAIHVRHPEPGVPMRSFVFRAACEMEH